jgi:type II secretory pathway pseudopilin PulG
MVTRSLPGRRHARPAFALLDVIVAGIIIGISLAVIIGLTGRALSSQTRGEDLQTAALLADEQLNLVLARGPDGYGRSFPSSGECDPPFQNFSYSLQFSGGSGSDPYRVSVTISWLAGGSGAPQSISLQTIIANREGDDPDPDRKPTETPSRIQ